MVLTVKYECACLLVCATCLFKRLMGKYSLAYSGNSQLSFVKDEKAFSYHSCLHKIIKSFSKSKFDEAN